MGKRDLQKEKQLELAAIWGSEVQGDARFPKRRGAAAKKDITAAEDDNDVDPDVLSDLDSDAGSVHSAHSDTVKKEVRKKAKSKKSSDYRLHCFIEPGTELNAVRTVFEAYEPKVLIRTSQKGSLLNKSQFAVLTFRNKPLALHAVKTLDGTNQRDLLGVTKLQMNLMLTRQQSKIARKKFNRKIRKDKERNMALEEQKDLEFIRGFLTQQLDTKKSK